MNAGEALTAVRAIAKGGDPDRYAAALFAPRETRDRLFALIAFNVELARIAEQVTEPQLGAIRLQWWRETLPRAFAGEPTGHPVADSLASAAKSAGLPFAPFAALIDARQFDVSAKIMPDEDALSRYLEDTAGTMFRLSGEIAGIRDARLSSAASAGGIAYGLTGLMRSLPLHLAKGRVDVPADLLKRHGVASAEILSGKTSQGVRDALASLAGTARRALREAKQEAAALPGEALDAFRPLALVEPYLSALDKEGDPLHVIANINPLYRLWRLATYRLR